MIAWHDNYIVRQDRWDKYVRDNYKLTWRSVSNRHLLIAGAWRTASEAKKSLSKMQVFAFAGIIVHKDLIDKDPLIWQVDCDDYTALLDRKLVVEVYENMPADEIFIDIATKYCDGLHVNGVCPVRHNRIHRRRIRIQAA